ncbi:MAG: BTAD domain-containing putative transcriptional regulator [Acidimicrobiales bacterium]
MTLLTALVASPVHGLRALLDLAESPARRLGDGALTDVLAGACWLAVLAVLATSTAAVARTTRPQTRLVPTGLSSATLSAIPATVAGEPAPGRQRRTGDGGTDTPHPPQRPEMPVRRPGPSKESPRPLPGRHAPMPAVVASSTVAPFAAAAPEHDSTPAASTPAALPLATHPSPAPAPAPPPQPPSPVAGHLEDREWTRALLGAAAAAPGAEMPLAWLLGQRGTAAFLEAGGDPSLPFKPHPSGVGWWMERDPRLVASLPPSGVVRASRRAGLVSLWNQEGSRGLLDLVVARSVALDGPPVAVGYTVADIVVELAARRWSDLDEVLLVGFGGEMHGLENVRYLPTLEEATALLSGTGHAGERGARCFVIAPMPIDESRRAALRRLLRLVEQTPCTGAVCCDTAVGARATWHLAAHGQTLRLEVSGRTGLSAVVSPYRWAERTGTSLRVAYRPMPSPTPTPVSAPPPAEGGAPASTAPDRAEDVGVFVLGRVQVAGSAESFEGRPLLQELVTYLAFHPEGATGEACATALWPERRVPPQTLSNRLHEARRALGPTPEGRPRLLRSGGRHVLAPDVTTDWSRFVALTGRGTGPASWRQALMLVRGRPFGGLAKGDWTVLEGFSAAIEGGIVEVASRLAEHLLDAGDLLGAEWSVRRGLMVAPWDERLYRLLMLAADAAGNRGGVESALRSLAQVLDCSGDPIECVHPETAALYRKLTESPPT